MFIQTEATPNPATLKFLPGRTVLDSGTAQFSSLAQAGQSPLAQRLFALDGVEGVFLGGDFVSVTKSASAQWDALKVVVLGALMAHFAAGHPVMISDGAADEESFDEADRAVVDQIKALIETRVRPAVAQDGGDIVFRSFDKGVVFLNMRGACAGCPSSTATLKMGIENMLKHYVPEVTEVRAVA